MKFHCASKSKMLKGVGGGQLEVLGDDFSRWMLLERVLFTLDGLECNKIGVGYEAFRSQPNFCSSPLDSCLGDQLSKFWEIDKNRVNNSQPPQYVVLGKFERINQYPVKFFLFSSYMPTLDKVF
jgi:hypothetical protein